MRSNAIMGSTTLTVTTLEAGDEGWERLNMSSLKTDDA
jgi:hypothetical protein